MYILPERTICIISLATWYHGCDLWWVTIKASLDSLSPVPFLLLSFLLLAFPWQGKAGMGLESDAWVQTGRPLAVWPWAGHFISAPQIPPQKMEEIPDGCLRKKIGKSVKMPYLGPGWVIGGASPSLLSPFSGFSPASLWPVGQRQAWPQQWLKARSFSSISYTLGTVSCFDTINIKPGSPCTGGDTSKTYNLLSAHTSLFILLAGPSNVTNLPWAWHPYAYKQPFQFLQGFLLFLKFAKVYEEVFLQERKPE